MTTFLNAVTDVVTPELASIAALAHGAPPESMQRALHGAIITILGGLAGKLRDPAVAQQVQVVVSHSSSAVAPRGVLDAVTGAGGNVLLLENGTKLVRELFGQSGDTIAGMIGKMAGLPDGTALLSHAASMALTLISAKMRADGVDASLALAALRDEREALRHAMPGPVAGMLRISDFVTASYPAIGDASVARGRVAPQPVPRRAPAEPETPRARRLLLPILAALASCALLGWAYLRG